MILLLALSLGVDAFAVSVSCGMSVPGFKRRDALWLCLYFGVFQAIMTLLGAFLGDHFGAYIGAFGRFAAFALLALIGASMVGSALRKDKKEKPVRDLSHRRMFLLAIAVSIDAFAAGISLALTAENIFLAALVIGLTAGLLSLLGSRFGEHVGNRFRKRAELVGGLTLIALGVYSLFA